MVNPRTFAGCSRIDSVIYCMSGFLRWENHRMPSLLNEHISLDLLQINNKNDDGNDDMGDTYFSMFNSSKLEWKQLSNINRATNQPTQLKAYLATAILSSEKSYVTYGGLQYNSTGNIVPPDYPFMKYNITDDIWYPLPSFNNTREFLRTSLVNIGNDVLWKYGGVPYISESAFDNGYSLFDYKNLTWIGPIVQNLQASNDAQITYTSGNTITLVGNVIYKLGGSFEYKNTILVSDERFYDSLNNINTFDSTTMKWTKFTAGGANPSRRDYHTATYLPDKNLILIFGGALTLGNDINALEFDNYAIYNITSNTYMEIEEPGDTPFPKERFGHYATLYNSKYLLLMFGSLRNSEPADIMNVVNITNPLKPVWITNINSVTINEEEIVDANHRLSTTTLIIVIVICVVGFLSLVIAIIYYIKRRIRKKKENIQLEKEDPRRSMYGIKEYNLIKPNSNGDYNNDEFKKRQQEEKLTLKNDDQIIIDCIKPSQVILCKPYENQYEDKILYIDEKVEVTKKSEQSSTLNSNSIYLKSSSPLSSLSPSTSLSSPSTEIQTSSIEICKPSKI